MRTKPLQPADREKLLLLSKNTGLRKLAKRLDIDQETLSRAGMGGHLRQATRESIEKKLQAEG